MLAYCLKNETFNFSQQFVDKVSPLYILLLFIIPDSSPIFPSTLWRRSFYIKRRRHRRLGNSLRDKAKQSRREKNDSESLTVLFCTKENENGKRAQGAIDVKKMEFTILTKRFVKFSTKRIVVSEKNPLDV